MKNNKINRTKKISLGGLLLALGILLPQMFHLTGVPQAGVVFLPMHIPVLIAGFILGPWYGLFIGIITPFISSMMMGMPPFGRLPFMMIELSLYGLSSGLLFSYFGLHVKKAGIYLSLVSSMLIGRVGYAAALFVAANLFHINCGSAFAAVTATISGLPGIAIQLIFIPAIIFALQRGGQLSEFCKQS